MQFLYIFRRPCQRKRRPCARYTRTLRGARLQSGPNGSCAIQRPLPSSPEGAHEGQRADIGNPYRSYTGVSRRLSDGSTRAELRTAHHKYGSSRGPLAPSTDRTHQPPNHVLRRGPRQGATLGERRDRPSEKKKKKRLLLFAMAVQAEVPRAGYVRKPPG